MSQRGVRTWQIADALTFGKRYNRAGAEWRVVRRKDLPPVVRDGKKAAKLDGLVVCIVDGEIATVYYREDPSHYIRCKAKRGR